MGSISPTSQGLGWSEVCWPRGPAEGAVVFAAAALGRRSGGLEVAGELWSSRAQRRAYL
jgi:hypothetical protein